MPFWKRKRLPDRPWRPEYMTVRDVANHAGTSGYVRIDSPNQGGLTGFTIARTSASQVGRSSEGQPWITREGTVTTAPDENLPWAFVANVAGQGLTLYLPDDFGNYVTLLADNPPEKWLPAAAGSRPAKTPQRGISAPDDTDQ